LENGSVPVALGAGLGALVPSGWFEVGADVRVGELEEVERRGRAGDAARQRLLPHAAARGRAVDQLREHRRHPGRIGESADDPDGAHSALSRESGVTGVQWRIHGCGPRCCCLRRERERLVRTRGHVSAHTRDRSDRPSADN